MANYPRYLLVTNEATFHVMWKCHNNEWLLSSELAKQTYYDLLLKYKKRYSVLFHSYCFMDNHPHLTGWCQTQKGLSDFFRVVNSCFAKTMNLHWARKGQVVMDRFRSPEIHTSADLLKVMFYIDLNPYRTTKMVLPNQFKWTSFHHYAYGKKDPLLTEPKCYQELGKNSFERQRCYLHMVVDLIDRDQWERKVFSKNYPDVFFVGDPEWVREKHELLKKHMREKRQKWRERLMQIGTSPPDMSPG